MLFDVEHAFHDEVEKTIPFFLYNQAALKCHSKFVTETSITKLVTVLKSKHFWQTTKKTIPIQHLRKAKCWVIIIVFCMKSIQFGELILIRFFSHFSSCLPKSFHSDTNMFFWKIINIQLPRSSNLGWVSSRPANLNFSLCDSCKENN